MNQRIQQINDQLAAVAARQAPLTAAIQRLINRKAASAKDFAAKTTARDAAGEPLAAAIKAEAMGTGSSAEVDAARAAIAAADADLAASKATMDRDAAEIEPVVASLQAEIDDISAEAAPLRDQMRQAQIDSLRADRDAAVKAYDSQIAKLCDLRVRALAADRYLAELGAASAYTNSHGNQFCVPTINTNEVTRHADLQPAVVVESVKLRDQWGIAPPQAPNTGLPWGIREPFEPVGQRLRSALAARNAA